MFPKKHEDSYKPTAITCVDKTDLPMDLLVLDMYIHRAGIMVLLALLLREYPKLTLKIEIFFSVLKPFQHFYQPKNHAKQISRM